MTELVARIQSGGAGVRMQDVFERATWPLRKFVWWLEEKVFWPVADALRGRGEHAAPSGVGVEAKPRKRRPDLRVAFATVGGAAVIGIGIAALVAGFGGGGSGSTSVSTPRIAATPSPPAAAAPKQQSAKVNTLHGAAPNFQSASKVTKSEAQANLQAPAQSNAQAQTQTSPTAATNSKPSAIPTGPADETAAMNTARDFAGAFVLYEVGRTNPKVKRTFAATATPALAKALKARPPRQPGSVKVPEAKVQNIVLSAPQDNGRQIEASVSLLRLGALSELRLTLTQRHGTWAVSEVRG
jgi:hypothetical protein